MKIQADLDEYQCPDHIFDLLCFWGRSQYSGMNIGFPTRAAVCGDYLRPRVKDDEELRSIDMDEFDQICEIIDNELGFAKQEALRCRFMHRMPDGKRWSKKHSASYMGLTVPEYLTLRRAAMREVDLKMAVKLEKIA